jgi:hypothetical protein
MSIAAKQGFEGAEAHSKYMALKMSTEQRKESQRLIEAFKPNKAEPNQIKDG